MRSHHYLEDIALSDLAFEAFGGTLSEMFEAAAQALTEAMVDIKQVRPRMERRIVLKSDAMDRLLFDWLSELIYLKDAEGLLFSRFEVEIKGDSPIELSAKVLGEPINPKRQNLHMDVKAVTYHLFDVVQQNGHWKARVVVDI